MSAINIQQLLPSAKQESINICRGLSNIIRQARGWEYTNLEETREQGEGSYREHILDHSRMVEDELERIDSCIKGLIEIKRILEDCDSKILWEFRHYNCLLQVL